MRAPPADREDSRPCPTTTSFSASPRTATAAEVRQAYARLAREKHPDRFTDPAEKAAGADRVLPGPDHGLQHPHQRAPPPGVRRRAPTSPCSEPPRRSRRTPTSAGCSCSRRASSGGGRPPAHRRPPRPGRGRAITRPSAAPSRATPARPRGHPGPRARRPARAAGRPPFHAELARRPRSAGPAAARPEGRWRRRCASHPEDAAESAAVADRDSARLELRGEAVHEDHLRGASPTSAASARGTRTASS